MKLGKFTPSTVDIDFGGEQKELIVDFAAIRAIGADCGNLTSVLMHIFNCAAGSEPADASTLAMFYAAILNRAGFRDGKRKIEPDQIYAAIMSDYAENLPTVVQSCGAVAAIMIPTSTVKVNESAEGEEAPKPKA